MTLLALALGGCASAGGGAAPGDADAPETGAPRPGEPPPRAAGEELEPGVAGEGAPALPPIPPRRGPVELRVQYPARHQPIAAADSNFLFGSVGTGDATLLIDGVPVPVEPNGAFLAWLPVPPRARGDTAVYRLVAWRKPGPDEAGAGRGGAVGAARDTQRLELPVLLPRVAPPVGAVAWVDTAGLARPRERWIRPGEPVELALVGGTGLHVWVEAGGRRFELERETLPGTDSLARYRTALDGEALRRAACGGAASPGRCRTHPRPVGGSPDPSAAGAFRAHPAPPGPDAGRTPTAELRLDSLRLPLRATRGHADTLAAELPLALAVLDPEERLEVVLEEAPDPVNGRAGVVVGRPTPYGPYRWRFPDGTRAAVTGRLGDRLRIRLLDGLDAWVEEQDARWAPASPPGPVRVFDGRVEPRPDRLVLRIGLERAVPVHVRQTGPRRLTLFLYGAAGETNRMAHGRGDPLLDGIEWDQLPGPLVAWSVDLAEPVWGWRVGYEEGDARGYEGPRAAPGALAPGEGPDRGAVLVLEVRRPPAIDPARPLRGRRIAVDPGHPGGGSRGPTGYYEGDANLAIGRRLAELLEEAGATPVLVRRDEGAVGLYERTARAVEADAELFVSIHNNALPDGVRPHGRAGTGTYYHHPHARDLARAVQAGMLAEMGLPDLGIVWGDLAVARLSWMPSVLAEGAFMMHPAHEAALRTSEFQERYARGVLRGLEAFLRGRAASRPPGP